MKNILLTFLFLFFLQPNIFACSCSQTNLDTSFLYSDFVAKVEILKKYENEENSEFYKVDILILDLYKGKNVKSIYIYGNYKYKQQSACWIFTEENEKLIIYATIGEQKLPTIYACERMKFLDKVTFTTKRGEYSRQNEYDEEIAVLETLKKNNINYSNSSNIRFNISAFLSLVNVVLDDEYNDDVIFNSFGIFEYKINKKFEISKVRVIKGFDKKIDRKIKKVLKLQKWSKKKAKERGIKAGSKTFVTIYFFKRNGYKYFRAKQM